MLCNYCMVDSEDSDNAAEQKFGAWSLWDMNGPMLQYTPGKKGGKYVTFQLSSALFGGYADKYLPMSAINGMRIILSCENVKGAFVLNGLQYRMPNTTPARYLNNAIASVEIVDSTFYMNI